MNNNTNFVFLYHDFRSYNNLHYSFSCGFIGLLCSSNSRPPLSYAALLILTAFTDFKCDDDFLWQWAAIVVGVTIADFWLQVYGVKKFGGTKKAVNGTMIGLFLGIITPIPLGFILWPF